jgi:RNA polymerase sigma-70 factor, ECF subfamily
MQEHPEDLSTLMRAANRGDASAYRRLLDALASSLRAGARRGLARAGRGPEDAEDIVQETLLAIHLKRHTWDESQPLEPWVRAIAHHKLVDGLRRRGFRQHLPIEDYEEILSVPAEPVALSAVECAELLSRLPGRQRQIVQAISIEGRSAREVGDRLGMTEGAVRVALHRALKGLADGLNRGGT